MQSVSKTAHLAGAASCPGSKKREAHRSYASAGDKSGLEGHHSDLTGGSEAHSRANPPVLKAAA